METDARGLPPCGVTPNPERYDVNELITISEMANEAFGAFDWSEHQGKGVRLFVQGFG